MNPYVIIAALLAIIGAFGSGVTVGLRWERADTLADELARADAAAKATSAAVEAATRTAMAEAEKAATRRAAARESRHKLEMELAKDEGARTCRVSDGTLRVLADVINSANAAAPKTGAGNGSVPAPAGTSGADRSGSSPLGIDLGRGLFGVPGAPSTTKGLDQ